MTDYSLFPKQEEWATGDEAVDSKLSRALKATIENLNFDTIKEFHQAALAVNLRLYNPSYKQYIDLVTRALLFHLSPHEFNNELMIKLQGDYFSKEKKVIDLPIENLITNELQINGHSRYKNELDIYYKHTPHLDRNPFIKEKLTNSTYELSVKILMKDFKEYLNGQSVPRVKEDLFFNSLRNKDQITRLSNIGEFWFSNDRIFCLSLL